jgi:hypothetical protein
VRLSLDDCEDLDAQVTLALEPDAPADIRVSCASSSVLTSVALRSLATDELVSALCAPQGHEMAYLVAVMRVVFGADDRATLHLREWEAADDGGGDDDGGEPMPVVVPLRRAV